MATITDLEIYRGEAVDLDFTISPVEDISGWTIMFTLARQKNSTFKTIERLCTITSGPAGTFRASLLRTDTDIAPGKYYWDVWRTNGGSDKPLGLGDFVVLKDIYNPQ